MQKNNAFKIFKCKTEMEYIIPNTKYFKLILELLQKAKYNESRKKVDVF
jgi:hypothetical protein